MQNLVEFFSKKNVEKTQRRFLSIANKKASFVYVEAYKSLRTNLEFISAENEAKTILITSALPDESKTSVAINMAISLASSGKKAIVVECDLRKPMMHYYLRIKNPQRGLTSVLLGNASVHEVVIELEELNISVLLAGKIPSNPSEMLGQKQMEKLVESLKEQYDYVIFDAPPISVVTDAAVLGRLADGALLVIRSKYASSYMIRSAKKKLEDVNIKILGAVITRYNVSKFREAYYYYSYNYASKKRNRTNET